MPNVTIHQLTSERGKCYLNVNEADGYISVYAHLHNNPVYIAWSGNHFWLYEFDSEEYADEFFEINGYKFDKIEKIEPFEENERTDT